uniref:Uncharacterized protein n=1 Tax=Leersia perrieri TaxID=77586 RepID=A0A0D9XCU9_9ORYZ
MATKSDAAFSCKPVTSSVLSTACQSYGCAVSVTGSMQVM